MDDPVDPPPRSIFPQVANGDEALARLMAGNARFATDHPVNPGRSNEHRVQLESTQAPFAIILGCSDSRVPSEIIFDQGLGDLFVVRVAGNTAIDPVVLGSIEYAVAMLGSVLLMVLGHEQCGAVTAALDSVAEGTPVPGHIHDVVQPIIPAAEAVVSHPPHARLDAAVKLNVKNQVRLLTASSAILQPAVAARRLKIVGAEYALGSGQVTRLA
ncbi:MAG: carbonic anhydrase [Acidimicrobiales bacterium]